MTSAKDKTLNTALAQIKEQVGEASPEVSSDSGTYSVASGVSIRPRKGERESIQPSRGSTETSWLILIALLAFLLRVGFGVATRSYEHPYLKDDGLIAYNLVQGKGFSEAFYGPERPTASQSPFHPVLIATVFTLFGINATAFFVLLLLRSAAVAAICILIERIARRLFSQRVALASALGTAVLPTLIYFCSGSKHLDSRSLYSALGLVGTLLCAYRFRERPTAARSIVFGVAAAAATLVETVMLPALPLLWWWMVRDDVRWWWPRPRMKVALWAPLVAVAILTPWCVRNAVIFKSFVPIKSSFGTLFWVANNPRSDGQFAVGDYEDRYIETEFAWSNLQAVRQATWFPFPSRKTLPPEIEGVIDDMWEAERDRVLLGEALRFVGEQPLRFLELTLRRFWCFVASPAQINSEPQSALAQLYPYQRSLNIAFLPFVLFGLIYFRGRKLGPIIILLCVWTATYSLVHSTYYYYRIPVEPLLVTLVVASLSEARHGLRTGKAAASLV